MSNEDPGPTHTPYGQPDPYGQPPGQPYPYGQPAYGQETGDRRPGTVTAAAWITIVCSVLVAALFGFVGLALFVARDEVISEMEAVPEFQDANIDADAVVGVLAAVVIGLVLWSLVALVLAVFVLRRSNVARILLVISSAVVALLSLLTITGGATVVTLIASVATIALLFVGGAGDWFKRAGGYPVGHPGGYPADPYASSAYPSSPYGAPPGQENPYGRQPAEGEGDDPPRDYPSR